MALVGVDPDCRAPVAGAATYHPALCRSDLQFLRREPRLLIRKVLLLSNQRRERLAIAAGRVVVDHVVAEFVIPVFDPKDGYPPARGALLHDVQRLRHLSTDVLKEHRAFG